MVCELRVIILAEGAVCIIDHGDGGDGSAVRRNGREGKERLIKLIGDVLAGIAGAAAAHGKDHVGFLHERVCDKGIAVFVGGIAAVGEEAQKLDVGAFYAFKQRRLCFFHSGLAAEDNSRFAEEARDIRHFVVAIRADGIARQMYAVIDIVVFHDKRSFGSPFEIA